MTSIDDELDVMRRRDAEMERLVSRGETRPLVFSWKNTLYAAPEFTQRLKGEEVVDEGADLILQFRVHGLPQPTLRWFKDDELIGDHQRWKVLEKGDGRYLLTLHHVNKGDEAAYRCRAENMEGASSCCFFLTVKGRFRSNKRRGRKTRKRTVSFPTKFSTIVEKVEEEEKATRETSVAPASPLSYFYDGLTLKGRCSWPSFLGDWAFVNGTGSRRGGCDIKGKSDDDQSKSWNPEDIVLEFADAEGVESDSVFSSQTPSDGNATAACYSTDSSQLPAENHQQGSKRRRFLPSNAHISSQRSSSRGLQIVTMKSQCVSGLAGLPFSRKVAITLAQVNPTLASATDYSSCSTVKSHPAKRRVQNTLSNTQLPGLSESSCSSVHGANLSIALSDIESGSQSGSFQEETKGLKYKTYQISDGGSISSDKHRIINDNNSPIHSTSNSTLPNNVECFQLSVDSGLTETTASGRSISVRGPLGSLILGSRRDADIKKSSNIQSPHANSISDKAKSYEFLKEKAKSKCVFKLKENPSLCFQKQMSDVSHAPSVRETNKNGMKDSVLSTVSSHETTLLRAKFAETSAFDNTDRNYRGKNAKSNRKCSDLEILKFGGLTKNEHRSDMFPRTCIESNLSKKHDQLVCVTISRRNPPVTAKVNPQPRVPCSEISVPRNQRANYCSEHEHMTTGFVDFSSHGKTLQTTGRQGLCNSTMSLDKNAANRIVEASNPCLQISSVSKSAFNRRHDNCEDDKSNRVWNYVIPVCLVTFLTLLFEIKPLLFVSIVLLVHICLVVMENFSGLSKQMPN